MAGFAEDNGSFASGPSSFCNGNIHGHSFVFVVFFARPLVGDLFARLLVGDLFAPC